MVEIYTRGSCLRLFQVLRLVYPDARAYLHDEEHILTMIDGRFWDITGEVHPRGYLIPVRNLPRRHIRDLWRLTNEKNNQPPLAG
jgi:hypothetical protein